MTIELLQELVKRQWKVGSFKEFTNEAGLRALFSEFLGTFMLVLIATGEILDSSCSKIMGVVNC